MKYAPVFEFQGRQFVIASREWLADTSEEADELGIAAMFVEGIVYGFRRCKENPIQEVPDGEGKLLADAGTLQGSAGELPIYINIHQNVPI